MNCKCKASVSKRIWKAILYLAVSFVVLLAGTAAQAAESDPFSTFYNALIGTLEEGSFSYDISFREEMNEYAYGYNTYCRGNMEFSFEDRELIIQAATGRDRYKDDSYYIYVKNGSYGLYSYDEKEWMEGFEPDLIDLFKILQGDLDKAADLFTSYQSDLDMDDLPYDPEKVVECLPALLQSLQSTAVLKDILHFESAGNEYYLDVDLYELIDLVLKELEPAYIGEMDYEVMLQDMLGEAAEQMKTMIDLTISFKVDDDHLTGLTAVLTEQYALEQLETEMNEETEHLAERKLAFQLAIEDIGGAKIYPPQSWQ